MGYYNVDCLKDVEKRYYFIRNMESYDIEEAPARYLTHKLKANCSPNTVRRSAFSICYYMEYMAEKKMELKDVYELEYDEQYQHFCEFLYWLKAGNHKENIVRQTSNGTCNAYLKDVFRFYLFMEMTEWQNCRLSVLFYNQISTVNAHGIKKTIRLKSFKGYLKAEERNVHAAQENEILTILEACTNCRDQLLILMASELGFRIGELLGINYAKDIDYEKRLVYVDFRVDNTNDARAKNAEERCGKISEDTYQFLLYYISEYWKILQKQNYLFINIKGDTMGQPMKVDSVYDMFERMEKKTGIKITPHMLRRYFGNTRWDAGWPLELISNAYGHKHLDTTIQYLKIIDDKVKDASQQFYERYGSIYGAEKLIGGE